MQLILDANDIDYEMVDGQITGAVIKAGDVLEYPCSAGLSNMN